MKVSDVDLCAFCPRLCRHVCPVAVGSGREAATPTAKMTSVWAWLTEHGTGDDAFAHAALCTSCGACTEACKLDRPVAALLSEARGALRPAPTPPPIAEIIGEGLLVAVETDDRRWSEALAARLGQPVARLWSPNELGEALLDHTDGLAAITDALRVRLAGRTLVVASGGAWRVVEKAGLDAQHLSTLVPIPDDLPTFVPCSGPPPAGTANPDAIACCGAAAPLPATHPTIAAEVGQDAAGRLRGELHATSDARCGRWLREHGAQILDPIDQLLAWHTSRERSPS